ncbi:tRNA (adenosine(37)-N6)-threonylcarbamoyltransferase complex dimerization subunit type 1 TsaB [Liquorilactobacillus vini]|uniref:Glycoprotein endopeptidase n=1 Tax=Liquorilactobacillus vini DSM 20605 TaxID=1133569 RepID=A0A0R2CD70_9LACO|nr:tRNA (adenosine(37)-N6)-threonylcarbamoyltransferase complex dimerization subunit type 1 TsaB [Liquorilactobacillus vini]KRM89301.1 glycoprotein endopeptidase [Liquorilactobacillus vini DSM 20605]
MIILAIDTSNQPLSVALLKDENLLATVTLNNQQKDHSTLLFPVINQLLVQAELKPDQLDRIVIAQGPGSYTGLRIGGTAAKMLAFTLKKELVSVSSLAVLAAPMTSIDSQTVIVPLFDARRQNVFAGVYSYSKGQLVNLVADQHLALTKLVEILAVYSKIIFVGGAAHKFGDFLQKNLPQKDLSWTTGILDYPQAYQLGLLGRKKQPLENIHAYVPAYLRLTQAETQWLAKHQEKLNEPLVEKF